MWSYWIDIYLSGLPVAATWANVSQRDPGERVNGIQLKSMLANYVWFVSSGSTNKSCRTDADWAGRLQLNYCRLSLPLFPFKCRPLESPMSCYLNEHYIGWHFHHFSSSARYLDIEAIRILHCLRQNIYILFKHMNRLNEFICLAELTIQMNITVSHSLLLSVYLC